MSRINNYADRVAFYNDQERAKKREAVSAWLKVNPRIGELSDGSFYMIDDGVAVVVEFPGVDAVWSVLDRDEKKADKFQSTITPGFAEAYIAACIKYLPAHDGLVTGAEKLADDNFRNSGIWGFNAQMIDEVTFRESEYYGGMCNAITAIVQEGE